MEPALKHVAELCGRRHLAMRRPQAEPDSPRRPAPCPGADGGAATGTPPSRPAWHSAVASANDLFSTLVGRVQGNATLHADDRRSVRLRRTELGEQRDAGHPAV